MGAGRPGGTLLPMAADPDNPDPIELNYAVAHEAIAAAVPDRPCILWGDRRFTWADVTDRTRRLAALRSRAFAR